MGNKTAKAKEKKCARETDQNRFPHLPPQKKNNAKFWLVRMREKQKKNCLMTFELSENMPFFAKLIFSHSYAN